MTGGTTAKPLSLILARELASNLATAMFLVDDRGYLVFYNDAAATMFGKPFSELGEMSANEWGEMLRPTTMDGTPLDTHHTPPATAYYHHRPAHDVFDITTFDHERRRVEVTAYPLFSTPEHMQGVLAIFWESPGDEETT